MGLISKVFGTANDRQVNKLEKIAAKIESLSDNYKAMSDDELKACTQDFKERLNAGETLDDILPEAYAVVREASDRVLGMRHFHVQLLGGIVLHQGRIAQMCTGEGKTLVATLPAYLNALTGKGMHIVTVNDYLARRDAEWMGKVYKFLGLSVGIIVSGMETAQKQEAYNCDICYATNNELGFDYLRDNMAIRKSDLLQRPLNFAIVDEVDSILIDEARTPLIISGAGGKSSEMYSRANSFAKTLREDDYIIEEKEKTVRLDDSGVAKAEAFFKLENFADIENQDLVHYVNNALKANFIMRKDIDYVVNDGEIVIVDEFTGRLMVGRRYSEGLHQAIEAKEGVRVQGESKTLATITFQNFFRLYRKLSGMTGTAKTEETEFTDIYRLDVVVLPTNKPIVRVDENDKLYTTLRGKLNAILKDITETHAKGQPVLIGTASVEKSEELSKMLTRAKIKHNVLNAKNHEREAEIIAQAGKLGAVTIATNMAGRGTDIVLGGNPEYMAKEKLENLGYPRTVIAEATSFATITDEQVIKAKADYDKYYALFKKDTDAEKEEVIKVGGLRIIGTGRHDSRRIDDQLRGRAGRQGDPGSSVFYLSMEDDMIRIFGGETLTNMAQKLKIEEDMPIEMKMLTSGIEKAQARIEDRDFSIRKHVLAYDDVMNVQRNIIYAERAKVLAGEDISEQIQKMINDETERIVDNYVDDSVDPSRWDYEAFNGALEQRVLANGTNLLNEENCSSANAYKIRDIVLDTVYDQYDKKVAAAEENGIDFKDVARVVLLKNVDSKWMDHIDNMHRLKQGIGLVAYGQKDPVVVYKQEGYEMFEEMTEAIARDTVTTLCKAVIEKSVQAKPVAQEVATSGGANTTTTVRKDKKVGRNDPCPCGSGKKYKNCCGQ